MASSEETMVTPQSNEGLKALEDLRPEHGAIVPTSPSGPPRVLGPSRSGGGVEVNAFWSERVQNDAVLRSMRPAALPDEGEGLQHLQEFLVERPNMNSPGSDPGVGIANHMYLRIMADENAKLKQELQFMRHALSNQGTGECRGGRPDGERGAHHHDSSLNWAGSHGGISEAVGSAVGGIKGLLGLKDHSASTLIPPLGGGPSAGSLMGLGPMGSGGQVEALCLTGPQLHGEGAGKPLGMGSLGSMAGVTTMGSETTNLLGLPPYRVERVGGDQVPVEQNGLGNVGIAQ